MRITASARRNGEVLFGPVHYSEDHVRRHMSAVARLLASGASEIIVVRPEPSGKVCHHYEVTKGGDDMSDRTA